MPKVLDGEVDLDLGELFRGVMTGEIAGTMRYGAPASFRWPKAITPARYALQMQWGIPTAINFESSGRTWRQGYSGGLLDGQYGAIVRRELGHPRPILYSADEAVTDLGAIADYFRGVNHSNGGILQGAYADARALDYLFAVGLISIGWEPNARGWYGDSVDSPHAAIVQRTSHSFNQFPWALYDESDVFKPDWGQTLLQVVSGTASPPPTIAQEDDIMAIQTKQGSTNRTGSITLDKQSKNLILQNGASVQGDRMTVYGFRIWPVPSGKVALLGYFGEYDKGHFGEPAHLRAVVVQDAAGHDFRAVVR